MPPRPTSNATTEPPIAAPKLRRTRRIHGATPPIEWIVAASAGTAQFGGVFLVFDAWAIRRAVADRNKSAVHVRTAKYRRLPEPQPRRQTAAA